MKRKSYILESELKVSREERQAFIENLKTFSAFKSEIFRNSKLEHVSQSIGRIIEAAQSVTLDETKDGWFDNITVNRDMKRLNESYKTFDKTINEIRVLQQRLESCYEDMAGSLSRYYDL